MPISASRNRLSFPPSYSSCAGTTRPRWPVEKEEAEQQGGRGYTVHYQQMNYGWQLRLWFRSSFCTSNAGHIFRRFSRFIIYFIIGDIILRYWARLCDFLSGHDKTTLLFWLDGSDGDSHGGGTCFRQMSLGFFVITATHCTRVKWVLSLCFWPF